jgi:hypothetical protein
MARIKLTPTAKVALYCLRFYLLFLVILIMIKFIRTIWHS